MISYRFFPKTVIRSVVTLYVILASKWKPTVRLTVITSCCPFWTVSTETLTIPLATVRPFTWPGLNTTSIPDAGVLSGFRTSAWMTQCINKCCPIKYGGWGWAKHPCMFVAYKFQVPLKKGKFKFSLCQNRNMQWCRFYRHIKGDSWFEIFGRFLKVDGVRGFDNLDVFQLCLDHFTTWCRKGNRLRNLFLDHLCTFGYFFYKQT